MYKLMIKANYLEISYCGQFYESFDHNEMNDALNMLRELNS